jgi:maltooligosyltrehalose trehalohydrolase
MGEEYGEDTPFFFFISHHDKNNIKAVQEGRRNEFANYGLKEGEDFPDPYDENTFNRCKLQWHKRNEGKYKVMLDWMKTLIKLRRTNAILQNFDKNNIQAYNINQEGLIVIRQDDEGKDFLVYAFNFSDKELNYTLPPYKELWHKILDSKDEQWMADEAPYPLPIDVKGGETVQLQPCSAVVYGSL